MANFLDPEVPDLNDDVCNTWRDPTILADSNAVRLARDNDQFNDYLEQAEAEKTPDDIWMLPAHCTVTDILGPRRQRLDDLRKSTGIYLVYNERKHQIDMWGGSNGITRIKNHLSDVVSQLTLQQENSRRKGKKWSKPERQMTEKERKRAERRQAREAEERSYQGLPAVPQPYTALVPLPDRSIPPGKLIGEKESYLNRLRADCKTFMWYDEGLNAFKVEGPFENNVTVAAMRLRNWYLKCCRVPQPRHIQVLEQPSVNMLVRFAKLPKNFVTHEYEVVTDDKQRASQYRLLESVTTGTLDKIPGANLIHLNGSEEPTLDSTALSDHLKTLNERNLKIMHEALELGLENMRLFEWEMRMKIQFGHILMLNYRVQSKEMTLERLTDKDFRSPKFRTAISPWIGQTIGSVNQLFEYLDRTCIQYQDSPRVHFTFDARQMPTFTEQPGMHGRRDTAPQRTAWDTKVICNFTKDGRVGLWNCLTSCEDLVAINCVDLESTYSYAINLQYARRLTADKDTPHGQFAERLRLGEERRPILAHVREFLPKRAIQKTRWFYGYGDWVVEVGRNEIWELDRIPQYHVPQDDLSKLPLDLNPVSPHLTVYKVSLYKEAWRNRFAENLALRIGEAPSWQARDFLGQPDEDIESIVAKAHEFVSILNSQVPLCYDERVQPSLV